jgi:hypothetical protein
MYATEVSMAGDVERDGNPRRDTRKQYLSGGVQCAEALNEQPTITRWTAEPKRDNDGNELTDEKDGKCYHEEPRPTENEHSNHAHEKKCEPATRPNDKPRLGVETPGNGWLDRVHWI